MAQTKEGAAKAVAKVLERYPDHFKRIGSIGGRRSNTGGFASNKVGRDGLTGPSRASVAGRKGGSISRRKTSTTTVAPVEDTQTTKDSSVIWEDGIIGSETRLAKEQAQSTEALKAGFISSVFHKTKG